VTDFASMVTYRMDIEGRVQGVGFRFFVLKAAQQLDIKGFVKNIKDRTVLVEAIGEENKMNEFIAACRQGPPAARVLNFKLSQLPSKDFPTFEIKRY